MPDIATSCLKEAMDGCIYVIHSASPSYLNAQDPEKDMLIPTIQSMRNVLESAHSTIVKKIVITSSLLAAMDIASGSVKSADYIYTEKDWNSCTYEEACRAAGPAAGITVYNASKALAEKAAYEFQKRPVVTFELASINSTTLFGPLLQPWIHKSTVNASTQMIYDLIDSKTEVPYIMPLFCNVQDVAKAHVWALEKPGAMGHRFFMNGPAFSLHKTIKYFADHHSHLRPRLPSSWVSFNWAYKVSELK